MQDQYKKRRETMLEKYGGEEGLKEHYRAMQRKSVKKGVKKGFSYATSEEQRDRANKRWGKSGTSS